MKKILIIFLCFLCIGCGKKVSKNTFRSVYEKYNDSDEYINLNLESADLIKYSSVKEINDIIDNGSGVIYFGSPKDNVSRRVIDILLDVVNNTDLNKIYYFDSLNSINGLDDIENKKLPLVLFVLEGKIVSYRVGTIGDKVDLSEDEIIEIYNFYTDGVHMVLQDACDESC